MKTGLIFVLLLLAVGVSGYLIAGSETPFKVSPLGNENPTPKIGCKPTFRDGGGPYYKPNSPFREKIVPEINNGEKLIVTGKVLKTDCATPVPNAVVDIWQANETGSYQDEWYRGRIKSDDSGNYKFETVIPKGYGEGTGYRPPHIHFKIFAGGKEIITSQMFFPEAKGKSGFDEAYIMKVETAGDSGSKVHNGYHNIILP
jgi:protocatechuate 3,4-dioxygenase beta subunit